MEGGGQPHQQYNGSQKADQRSHPAGRHTGQQQPACLRGRRAAAVTLCSRKTHFGGQKVQMLVQNIPASDFNSWMQRQECGWGGEHGFVDLLQYSS